MDEEMKFVDLCRTLDKIYSAEKDKKLKLLNKLLDYCRSSKETVGGSNKQSLFYQVVRLLLPKLESERGPYGLKTHSLGKLYCRVLCIVNDSLDAEKLQNFRSPAAGSSAGDFADVAYWVLKSRCGEGRALTIDQVNSHLDNIATFHAEKKPRSVDEELTSLVHHMSAEEQKWLIRILLKDMRMRLQQAQILHAIHPDASDLYDMCNNLRKVCDTLKDPSKRLHEIEVTLFDPCRPMLSDMCNILNVETVLQKAPFYFLERKHDGERFQVHMENGSFRYFSRNGYEYTDNFGATSNSGVVTPQLSKQLSCDVKSCILDGEMMGWNKQWKCFGSKAMKFDVKTLREGNKYRPCFCVFDVLLLNGEVLTNKPLEDRLEILHKVFTPLEGVFMHTPRKRVSNSSEVVKSLNDAIDNQEEGLILKDPRSVYKPATKKGGWYKIKPEYTDRLNDDLDLLIIGGYYGEGQRRANINHFLLGVAVPPKVEGEHPSEFHSVCRVGSGYSREELSELLEKLSPYFMKVKPGQMPSGVLWTKERPDLWIPPCHSYILQVKASEIQASDQYQTGCTLRFPRVVDVRYDKKWNECFTVDQLQSLRSSNNGKLTSKHVNLDDLENASPRKRQRSKATASVSSEYKVADTAGVEQTGNRLFGKEFVVIIGNDRVSKHELEQLIVREGGTVVANRGSDTYCGIAGTTKHVKYKHMAMHGGINVASVDWLLRFLDGNNDPWTPHDLLCMSERTKEEMALKYDRFLDGFQKPTNLENLKVSLQKVSDEGAFVNLLPSEMADLDEELFSGPNEYAIFRCCVAYFLIPELSTIGRECDMLHILFRFQGGRISNSLASDITHVVVHPQDVENHAHIFKENRFRHKKFHIVTYDWIESCWTAKQHLNESDFHPKSLLR